MKATVEPNGNTVFPLANINSWAERQFVEAFEDVTSLATKVPQSAFLGEGKFPIIDQGEAFIAGHSNDDSAVWSGKLPVIVFGDHTRALKFIDFPFVLGADGCKVLLPRQELYPKFAYYLLKSLNLAGAGYSRHFKFLRETSVRYPNFPEQQRIAGLLEQADRLRRTRRYALELSDAFLPAAFLELFGDPMRNTKGWPVIMVEEAGGVQLGRQRAPKYQSGRFRTPYIRVANVYENEIDLSDLLYMDFDASDFTAYKLEHGDILLNEGQSTELVGRPAMWRNEIPNCCFQNTLIRFQANRKLCHPSYALWLFIKYLHLGEFAKISAKTSSVAHLGAFRLAQMRFPLPPLPLQQNFAILVERVERLRAVQRESLRQANHLFQSLMHQAFGECG